MKLHSNKAETDDKRRMFHYMYRSAQRYANRHKQLARKLKAQRAHLDQQREELGATGLPGLLSYPSYLTKHKRKYNVHFQKIEAEQARHDVERREREAQERAAIKAEARIELASELITG